MSPANLQGLNIVHPTSPAGDSRDLVGQPYPDLAAQLDLWTSLAFDSDEGPVSKSDDDALPRKPVDDDDDDRSSSTRGSPDYNSYRNALDINSLLAGFGIDPFSSPQQSAAIAPSLAQLLALHATGGAPPPAQQQKTKPIKKSAHADGADDALPPTKRPRNRKTSEILAAASDGTLTTEQATVLAAEDKRRRNTAASARFRLKKKEREAALEGKAKELEGKVTELERECEALRRENGWLKGLVIGVTGAAQAPVVSAPQFATTSKRSREEADD
ncbi:hypothetical protein AX14_008364 [Amanita brunnescens Koide BX004]|nr:hypothetical protein AX14_008364 [Amanita brunnescens Koide BX004]